MVFSPASPLPPAKEKLRYGAGFNEQIKFIDLKSVSCFFGTQMPYIAIGRFFKMLGESLPPRHCIGNA